MIDHKLAREPDPAALEKLLSESDEERGIQGALQTHAEKQPSRWFTIGRYLVEALLILTAVYLWLTKNPESSTSQVTFTPASEAIHYEPRIFTAGYLPGEKSQFQLACPDCRPTDAIDTAWSELYDGRMWSHIPRSQAAQLRNYTINIPGNEDHYLIGLDVFHQLHCLDNVRKGLWPDRYRPKDHMGGQGMSLLSAKHLDHCIDQIRQSIMCQSDLSVNWLFWDPSYGANMGAREVEHSCRSFDRVVEWAQERRQDPFDLTVRLYDPLKGI